MAKIVDFVYSLIIFLSIFLVATMSEPRKPFKTFFSTSYTIYYPILVTLFILVFFLLQEVIDVLLILFVHQICAPWYDTKVCAFYV